MKIFKIRTHDGTKQVEADYFVAGGSLHLYTKDPESAVATETAIYADGFWQSIEEVKKC